jgi:hypothetical protein
VTTRLDENRDPAGAAPPGPPPREAPVPSVRAEGTAPGDRTRSGIVALVAAVLAIAVMSVAMVLALVR